MSKHTLTAPAAYELGLSDGFLAAEHAHEVRDRVELYTACADEVMVLAADPNCRFADGALSAYEEAFTHGWNSLSR